MMTNFHSPFELFPTIGFQIITEALFQLKIHQVSD